jgi:hypothetical protein
MFPNRRAPISLAASCALVVLGAISAHATPLDFLPVGDPLEDELRVLEIMGPGPGPRHFGMRPLQMIGLPDFSAAAADPTRSIASLRLERSLARDRAATGAGSPATPRLLQLASPGDQRFETSVALEGQAIVGRGRDPDLSSGSGGHLRAAAQIGHWLAYSHVMVGRVDQGLRFAEAVFPGNDVVTHSEEAYLAYTGDSASWSAQLGRSRWHWGPGYEGALMLSRTSAPLTGMALHFRVSPLRADGMILVANLNSLGGERLAAHRAEWQPRDGLRVGVSEAVRYRSNGTEPLYLVGLPFSLVQNLLVRDQPESTAALRNNILAGTDVAWRVAPGTRVYGELLIDDLRTDVSNAINKYGWQLGWEGVGTVRDQRVTWGTEFTRLTRFVYTSFFNRSFVAEGRPLGFPTGPDARRLTVRGTWDPATEWQAWAITSRTDAGESGINVPFVPGSPRVPTDRFAGVVESTRELEAGLRWWPASGVDVSVSAGYRWVKNVGHVSGVDHEEPHARLSLRLVR